MRFRWAVSALITVVLLVMVSVALVSVYFLFIQDYIASTGSAADNTPPQLAVESSSINGPLLTLYVANEGTDRGIIDAVYLEDLATGDLVRVPLGEVVVEPGEVIVLVVPLPPGLNTGKYLIKLAGPSYMSAPVAVTLTSENVAWSRFVRVTITNALAEELRDYQVRVVLDSNSFDFSATAPGGSDLRFYDLSTGTPLPYWIEAWDPVGGSAVVWVKVPSIPASSDKTIALYYGNPSARPMSCGPCTFDFFDDFEDGDVSDWRAYDATIEAATLGGRGVIKLVPGSATNFQHFAVPVPLDLNLTSYIVEGVLYDPNPAGSFLVHYLDDGNWWGIELYAGKHIFRPIIGWADKGWVYKTYGTTPTAQWYRLRVDVLPDSVTTYVNGTRVASWTIDPAYQFSDYTKVGIVEHRGYGPLYVDYMFVRKYAPQEPSVTVGP